MYSQIFNLTATTQGPLYPPSEIMDQNGHFVVVGNIIKFGEVSWGMAIVDRNSVLPDFGSYYPYKILENLEHANEEQLDNIELFSLPLPLPLNNYSMVFAPEQAPNAAKTIRASLPLNKGYIYDYRESDGRRNISKIKLKHWLKAEGKLIITINENKTKARFDFLFKKLIPNSLYTVMSLRELDLSPEHPTRPGPLGIPNVFTTNDQGDGNYYAELDNPFPQKEKNSNRIINVIVLFMSSQQSYGGAIGLYGLGGDVHAQLKLDQTHLFDNLITNFWEDK
ncbi:hypothetical protein RHO12_11620 [Orbus sturtevantii]|uniref:hypothetical protein n=1 Tax=Orbus sturtevantii TaxID=3074109 RepID=UPI00370D00CD